MGSDTSFGTSVSSSVREQLQQKREQLWMVVMLNDDYTPFDWVIDILIRVFGRPHDEAIAVTKSVHCTGRGVAGVYQRAKALRLAALAVRLAREAGHPFTCIAEPFIHEEDDGGSMSV